MSNNMRELVSRFGNALTPVLTLLRVLQRGSRPDDAFLDMVLSSVKEVEQIITEIKNERN